MSGQPERGTRDFAEYAVAAYRRAEEAGRRVVELRIWLEQLSGSPALASQGDVRSSGGAAVNAHEHAAEAARRLLRAYSRAADAHDRAAEIHEWLAGERTADERGTCHQQQAEQHRRAAAFDRAASTRNDHDR
jgi:hypothetical protein